MELIMNAETTLQTVQAWPIGEQLDFLFRTWDQLLDSGFQPTITEELQAELQHRLATYEADPTRVLTWEQVEAQVRRPQRDLPSP